MEEMKHILHSIMVESINIFEEIEKKGIDLSKY